MSLDQELLVQIDKYKEIMQKDPNSREFLTLAELYRKLGVAEEATNILKEGLKKHPDYVDARLAVARIFLTQGQVEDATREFEEVIRQDARNFVAYKLLGEIAMQKQAHEKAAERFGAAYTLKPDDQECKVMLDYIGSLLGRDVTPLLKAGAAPRKAKLAGPLPPPGETIAVAPAGEFGEFEALENIEDMGELGEEIESFAEAEEFEEVEEMRVPADIEDIEGLGAGGDFEIEEFVENELEAVEETQEELSLEEVEAFEGEELAELEDFEEGEIEAVAEEPGASLEEPAGGEEELVAQIFEELATSKYTSEINGDMLDTAEGDLEDLMGLLESEEPEEMGKELGLGEAEEEGTEAIEEVKDLEELIDLEGVPGMEDLSGAEDLSAFEEVEEVEVLEEFGAGEEEVEEEIQEIEEFEEFEEIEEIAEPAAIYETEAGEGTDALEQEERAEQSSIFQDFGLAGEGEEEPGPKEGDVFQDFDFDVFEQELLKDHPSPEDRETFEEPGAPEDLSVAEEVPMEPMEAVEPLEELLEEVELEEFGEAEAVFVEEESEREEPAGEGELPATSLAELYIKQDLFDEATSIYRKILRQDPADRMIRQMLEETLALQAYVEGLE